jgi:DNA (cytosine-5)-methyltransferase 1
VDHHEDCIGSLHLNRPNWNAIQLSTEELANQDIKRYLPTNVDEIDLVTHHAPFQKINQASDDDFVSKNQDHTSYHLAKILKQTKAKMFMMICVKETLNDEQGQHLQGIIQIINSMNDYDIKWRVLDSVDYSVAQVRQKLIVVGIRHDLKNKTSFDFPKPHEKKYVLKDVLQDVPQSLGILYSDYKKGVMDLVPMGGNWKHLPYKVAKIYMGKALEANGGKTSYARRLHWDYPSPPLSNSPSQKQTERCHPTETRPLTLAEYKRIQTFPDDWQLHGTSITQYRQVGGAVPVNMAKAIGQSIYKTLSKLENK